MENVDILNQKPRQNSFYLLRLLAAGLVFVSHQYALLGLQQPFTIAGNSLGTLGVQIFFAISGYLVTKSWLANPSLMRFLQNRFLRIWPALTVVVVLCVFILGPIVTLRPIDDYFLDKQTYQYFDILLMKIRYYLPGVFESNPYPGAVNGSLWTIPYEVTCYLIFAILACTGLFKNPLIALSVWVLILSALLLSNPPKPNFLLEFGAYFATGSASAYYEGMLKSRRFLMAGALIAALTVLFVFEQSKVALAIAIPIAVIWVGLININLSDRLERYGDISYGFYIYAFPVQQLCIHTLIDSGSYLLIATISFTLTAAAAYLSWRYIEKTAMLLRLFGVAKK